MPLAVKRGWVWLGCGIASKRTRWGAWRVHAGPNAWFSRVLAEHDVARLAARSSPLVTTAIARGKLTLAQTQRPKVNQSQDAPSSARRREGLPSRRLPREQRHTSREPSWRAVRNKHQHSKGLRVLACICELQNLSSLLFRPRPSSNMLHRVVVARLLRVVPGTSASAVGTASAAVGHPRKRTVSDACLSIMHAHLFLCCSLNVVFFLRGARFLSA